MSPTRFTQPRPDLIGSERARGLSDRLFVLGLMLLATFLAFFRIGDKALWFDEVASLEFALAEPLAWTADHNMSLYYALLGGVVRVLGRSELALRSASALCFIASVGLFYRIATRWLDREGARAASLLMVTHTTLIHFAQEARGYMLAQLLVLAATWCWLRGLASPSRAHAVRYAVSAALAVYAHLFAALVAFAQACVLAWYAVRTRSARRRFLLAYGLLLVLVLPLAIQALCAGGDQVAWLYRPSVRSVFETLRFLAGGHVLGSVVYSVALLLLIARLLRGAPPEAAPDVLVLAWALLPVVIAVLVSLFYSPILHPRYLLMIAPAYVLALARVLVRFPLLARRLVVGALLLANGERLHDWYTHVERERFREAIAELGARVQPGDAIVVEAMSRAPFDYYVERLGLIAELPVPLFPAAPWGLPLPDEGDAPQLAVLEGRFAVAPRIWLLSNRVDEHPLRDAIAKTHARVAQLHYEPRDGDHESVFADSEGRIVTLDCFERTHGGRGGAL